MHAVKTVDNARLFRRPSLVSMSQPPNCVVTQDQLRVQRQDARVALTIEPGIPAIENLTN